MSNIRVTYSGLISLVVALGGVIGGLVFTLIITRQLSPEELGAWGVLSSILAYVMIVNPLVSYWNTRETARGEDSGKTAIYSGGFFSAVAMLSFVCLSFLIAENVNMDIWTMLFAVILIPVDFLTGVLLGIARGYRPHDMEYGVIGFVMAKIPIALVLVYFLDWGIDGLILTVFLANFVAILILIVRIREKITGAFDRNYIKKWLKLFWIPTFARLIEIVTVTDVVIFSFFSNSTSGVAFWVVGNAVSRLVGYTIKIVNPTYAKLLSGAHVRYFHESFILMLYFAIPLCTISFTFAKPMLFALNPMYVAAFPLVYVLTLLTLLRTVTNFCLITLAGVEDVDMNEHIKFRDYVHSKLFRVPLLQGIQRVVYLVVLSVVLWILTVAGNPSALDMVWWWALAALVLEIPLVTYMWVLAKRNFVGEVDSLAIVKYCGVAALVFTGIHLLMEQYLEYEESVFEFLPSMIVFLSLGTGGYIGGTYAMDWRTRRLMKRVILELSNRRR